MAITVHNLQHRLQLEDLNFSDFQAKVITAQMDAAQDGVLTEEEIEEASAKDIANKLKATPQHLAELKALEIALEYEQAKISDAQRSQERIRSQERLRTKRTQNESDDFPTSPAYSKTSTLTRSPRMNESRSSAGFGSTEPRISRMGVGRQNNLGSKIGRFSVEELRETSTKTKREHEREATMTDYFRLRKELEAAQQQNVDLQLKLNKVVDENQQTLAKAQAQISALEKEKVRLAKVNRVYGAGYGSIVSKLNDLQVKSQKLVPGVLCLKDGKVSTDFCELDRSIARLLDSVKQSILQANEADVQPPNLGPNNPTLPDDVAPVSSSNQISIGLQKMDTLSFARRNPISAMKEARPPPLSPSAVKQNDLSDITAVDKKGVPNGYDKFLEVRKGARPTAKSASQTDLDDMMRDLFVESCQAAATKKVFVTADGLYMSFDQFMKLLDAARLLDDNVKIETVQPLFTKIVNHASVGKKKFRNRVDLKGMIDLMKEVAYLKFPTLSEAGRWNRIQRSYLFRLREDMFATQTAIDGPAASMSSSSGGMARPQVAAFMQKHREPLLKMFRRFAHLDTGRGGNSMREGNATLSAKALQSLAEDYGIVPGLIDVKRILELRPGSDVDEKFDFSAFCDWLGALAMSLYSSGYDDLAPEGFALEYPSLELKIQRLFYDIDKRGVIFDLRGIDGKKTPFAKKRGAANPPTKGLKAKYMILIDDDVDRQGVTFELRGSDGQTVPFSKKRIENSTQGLKATITQNFSDPKSKFTAIPDPKQKGKNAKTANTTEEKAEEQTDEGAAEEARLRQAKVLFRTKAGTDGHLDKRAFVSLTQSMLEAGVIPVDAPSDADLQKAFEDADVKKSGFVDIDTFVVLYSSIQAGKVKGIGSTTTSWLSSGSLGSTATSWFG